METDTNISDTNVKTEVKIHSVRGDLLQAILNYLVQRPYIEVREMVEALLEFSKDE